MKKVTKPKAIIGKLIKICPQKRHAWFESNVGPIRKSINNFSHSHMK